MGADVAWFETLTGAVTTAGFGHEIDKLDDFAAVRLVNADEAAAGLCLAAQRSKDPHPSPDSGARTLSDATRASGSLSP